jgi:hypothetical protein
MSFLTEFLLLVFYFKFFFHSFATAPVVHDLPRLPPEDVDDMSTIQQDMTSLVELINKTNSAMDETGMATMLLKEVSSMLADPENARNIKLGGETEQAINKSCLTILGRLMCLGQTLPEFKRAVNTIKSSVADYLKQEGSPAHASQLAHTVLTLAQDMMLSVFDPMRDSGK